MSVYSRALISAAETCLLAARHPALRRQDSSSGHSVERENLFLTRTGVGADALVVAKGVCNGITAKGCSSPLPNITQLARG